jgi:DNA primase
MKDVMCFHELGFPAIAPQSETMFITAEMFESLKQRFKSFYALLDNDLPGIRAAKKFKRLFPEIRFVYIGDRRYKDISDAVKALGLRKVKKHITDFLNSEHEYNRNRY